MIKDYTITPYREYEDGSLSSETYGKYDTAYGWWMHRDNGPAMICYFPDSAIRQEIYLMNDFMHRVDGPAFIRYNADGSIDRESHFLLSYYVSKKDFYTPGFIDAFLLEHS